MKIQILKNNYIFVVIWNDQSSNFNKMKIEVLIIIFRRKYNLNKLEGDCHGLKSSELKPD